MRNLVSAVAATSLILAGAAIAQDASSGTAVNQSSGTTTGSGLDLSHAESTVRNVTENGALKAEPGSKPNPSGQSSGDYKPRQKGLHINQPPSPSSTSGPGQ